jgi:uncharacterized protein YcbX
MQISSITVYPIKGCAGIELTQVRLDPRGLENDRKWVVVDESNRFISQRSHPEMCRIRVELTNSGLIVSHPDFDEQIIDSSESDGKSTVSIWDDTVVAQNSSKAAAEWFSTVLGQPLWLARIGDDYKRNIRLNDNVLESEVHFGDAFPILVITEASLNNLNNRLESAVPMNRFRPNIVISGSEAHDEDTWKEIRVGDIALSYGKKCGRCTVTTVDQITAESSLEPLRTLSTYRKEGSKVCFGSYYSPTTLGQICVGDVIEVR